MTEIYEVSAPQARADELVKWLAGKGQAADLLSAAAAKQDYATIIARVLEDSASLLKAVNDEGWLLGKMRLERRPLVEARAHVVHTPICISPLQSSKARSR